MNLVELLLKPVIWACIKTGRVFNITGTDGPDDIYLIRYYVVKSKWFNIFIHIFLRSDRDALHDHPWNFGTFVVRGGYRESVPMYGNMCCVLRTNMRYTWLHRWGTRKAEQLHRVILDRNYTMDEKDEAPMTICFTGRTRREWGFMKVLSTYDQGNKILNQSANDQEWIKWTKYLGIPDDTPTRG